MLSYQLDIGQVVTACAGRDEGKLFFIINIIDSQYVHIADGKSRKVDSPKLKKVKHLKKLNIINDSVRAKILSGENVTDSFLRAELKKLNK
ncbi:KOW domain-containing protein [Peptacetobacter hominis]|uniref:KOW domain-containing protein n=1 Tax=Peptacetobacter hominis TaxID=2743610 RepID=A0A544QUF0_9FIRM|nr:KOW domain-containing RNA-binding protein [Peptacetobacter hominis]TQQ84319.1 KOW domain-containing protein [Peptacetobacter hominis]